MTLDFDDAADALLHQMRKDAMTKPRTFTTPKQPQPKVEFTFSIKIDAAELQKWDSAKVSALMIGLAQVIAAGADHAR